MILLQTTDKSLVTVFPVQYVVLSLHIFFFLLCTSFVKGKKEKEKKIVVKSLCTVSRDSKQQAEVLTCARHAGKHFG